jgi:hypothetical protein
MHGVLKHGMIFYYVDFISNLLAHCIPKAKTPLDSGALEFYMASYLMYCVCVS